MTVSALVLAAGYSERFGSDKRIALLPDGNSILDNVINKLYQPSKEIFVIVRKNETNKFAIKPKCSFINYEGISTGLGWSLSFGIKTLRNITVSDSIAVYLADMPWLKIETILDLYSHAASNRIVIPVFNGKNGHPVIFGKSFWDDLEKCEGNIGAKEVIYRNKDSTIFVNFQDPGILKDIDRPSDL